MSARIGAMIVHAAAAGGAPPGALERATGFAASRAADPDARIPLALETALWEEAARLTGDADFGLHSAERLRPGAFDVLDYAIRTAPTPRASLERLARYNRIEHDAAVFTLVERDDVTRLEHRLGAGGLVQSRHAAEFTLAAVIVVGGQLTGAGLAPRAVELSARATGVHRRARAPVRRRPPLRDGRSTPSSGRARSWSGPTSPPIRPWAERWSATRRCCWRPRPPVVASTGERVRTLIASRLGTSEVSLAGAAQELKMSARSLQRRLAADGITFDALLDDVRRGLAQRYLADPSIAISAVAYLLGYAEPSPFHRAIKRWTGTTAGEVRRAAIETAATASH